MRWYNNSCDFWPIKMWEFNSGWKTSEHINEKEKAKSGTRKRVRLKLKGDAHSFNTTWGDSVRWQIIRTNGFQNKEDPQRHGITHLCGKIDGQGAPLLTFYLLPILIVSRQEKHQGNTHFPTPRTHSMVLLDVSWSCSKTLSDNIRLKSHTCNIHHEW